MITTLRGILTAIHRALTERTTGFSETEASDYLTNEDRDDGCDFEPSNKPWDNFPWLQRGDTVAVVQLADGTIWTGPFDPDSASGIQPNTIQRQTDVRPWTLTLTSAARGDGAADRPAPDAPTPEVPGGATPPANYSTPQPTPSKD